LVTAVVVGGDEGRTAWLNWCQQRPSTDGPLDGGSARLLPLLYAPLLRDDKDLPFRDLVVNRYRKSLLAHQMTLHRALPALRLLQAAGYDPMVTKGVSLAVRFYDDLGARMISDVDVVIRDDVAGALELLECNGWSGADATIPAAQVLTRSHAVNLVDGRGGSLDVHSRMMALSRPGLDGPVFDRAVPTRLGDMTVLMPCAADELLLAVVHGWAWSKESSIRWIPDVAAIEPSMGPDDWQLLIAEAHHRQVSFRAWSALSAAHSFGVAVPDWVLDDLANGPFERFEQAEQRWHTTPHNHVPPGVFAYFEYVRRSGPPAGVSWWRGFAEYYMSLIAMPAGGNPVKWLILKGKRRAERS